MSHECRWDPSIVNRGDDVDGFLAPNLGKSDRRILLVAGAGFDPRALVVAARLRDMDLIVHAVLIKEKRPDPPQNLLDRTNANEDALCANAGTAA